MSPVFRVVARLFAFLPVLYGSVAVWAQGTVTPLAGEYSLSGPLAGDQTRPALAFGAAGGYVVWQDPVTDGEGSGISAQRLNNNLSGSFAPFRVNQLSAGHQEFPQAAVLPNGGAVFVWQGGALGFQKIYARFLNPDGTFATGDLLVGADTNQPSLQPTVAVLAGGDVVVAWGRMQGDGHLSGVCARRLSATGALLGDEWQVNQTTLYNQSRPALAALTDGGLVITWVSESARGVDTRVSETTVETYAVDIFARRFGAAGNPLGNEFMVNTEPLRCDNPAVAAAPDGGFTIVWEQRAVERTNSLDILARCFNAVGAPLAAPVVVNQTTRGDQYSPRVARFGETWLVLWTSLGQDGSYEGIYGRTLTGSGLASGGEFLVNTTTLNRQFHPAVAADTAGRLLVVWSSFTGVTTGCDLYAQRYASGQPLPTPPPPSVSALGQARLAVSWAELAGYDLAHYAIHVNGEVIPLTTTNQMLIVSNLVAGSTHSFRLEYVLRDTRRSGISTASVGTTWGEDANFDGLPDDWQSRYWGLNPLGWPTGVADSDSDGATNLQEFLAGTNPVDPASSLKLGMIRNGQGLWLNWNTEPGFVYQVQVSTNATVWQNIGRARFAPGSMDEMQVTGLDLRLYRILRIR